MSPAYLILFLIAAALNSGAQLLLKKGALVISPILAGSDALPIKLFRILTNPFIAVAIVVLATGMLVWIKIISQIQLSRAYPVNIALTVIVTSIAALFLFDETMSWMKFGGIALALVGIWMILTS